MSLNEPAIVLPLHSSPQILPFAAAIRPISKMQETNRYFGLITIVTFSAVLLSLWENMLSTTVFALSNGGPAGLVWGYTTCMIGFGFVTASLAEMASM